ncbi:MAG: hypothetical protein ACWGQW_00700 [bacterium]
MNQPKTDFYALNARRRNASRAKATHAVKSVNKDGSISKMRVHDMDLCRSQEQAEQRKAQLENLNPGRTFVVVEL